MVCGSTIAVSKQESLLQHNSSDVMVVAIGWVGVVAARIGVGAVAVEARNPGSHAGSAVMTLGR